LPREVFFCFFGFAGAVGVFAAPSGFGLLGDTCSSFGFGTPVDAVLRGRRSAVNGWNAQVDPPLPRFEAARTLLLMRARAAS
jgi:hypothetical protein